MESFNCFTFRKRVSKKSKKSNLYNLDIFFNLEKCANAIQTLVLGYIL